MKPILAALVCGLLFGAGLVVSEMINPAKIFGFLDITGVWDPSLMLVMAGAVAAESEAATKYLAGSAANLALHPALQK